MICPDCQEAALNEEGECPECGFCIDDEEEDLEYGDDDVGAEDGPGVR